MGGGSVFRGMARLVGAATVGAAAVPTAGAFCHVHPPVSASMREQESFSATLIHSQKGSCDLNINLNEFMPSMDVRFEHEEDECSLAEKEEGAPTFCRRVFSPPPTVEEVEEATKELHAALHLSLPTQASPLEEQQPESITGIASRDDNMDINPKDKRVTTTSYPHHLGALAAESSSVMQAFQLLQTNPKVQDVVKSLACDPAVWNAVLSNEKVLELTQEDSQESYIDDDDDDDDDNAFLESEEETLTSKLYGMVMTRTKVYYGSVKGRVVSVLNSMFGSVEKTIFLKEGRSAKDKTVTSCMMLAVAVVIIVVMRRSFRGYST